jgi:hypothetical protein
MANFDELFKQFQQPQITPFTFACANYTQHGSRLQMHFKKPTNEKLYDDIKKG